MLVGQFRAPRYVAARQPRGDGRPRPQSPRPHPPPVRRQWPLPEGEGSHCPRLLPALSLPHPRAAGCPSPFPAAAAARAPEDPRLRPVSALRDSAAGAAASPAAPGPRPHRPARNTAFALRVAAVPLRARRPSLTRRGAFCLPERAGARIPVADRVPARTVGCGDRAWQGPPPAPPLPLPLPGGPLLPGVSERGGGGLGWRALASCQLTRGQRWERAAAEGGGRGG